MTAPHCPRCYADAADLGGYFECTLCGHGFAPAYPLPWTDAPVGGEHVVTAADGALVYRGPDSGRLMELYRAARAGGPGPGDPGDSATLS